MRLQDAKEENLAIEKVHMVLGNQMHKGKIDRKNVARHSDALIWVTEGHTHYEFSDGSSFTVSPGELFYLAKGACYSMEVQTNPYRFIYIDFDFQHPDGEQFQSTVLETAKAEEMENLFLKLERNWLRKRCGYRLECQAVLYEVLARILQQKEWGYIAPEKRKLIESVVQQLTERYMEPEVTIESIAQEMGISDAYFRKLFRGVYQISPTRYLTGIRIRQAKNLLRYQHQSVTEIAALCGYSNVYYFSRVFRKETGMTPTEYVRKHGVPEGDIT